jgi:hypothetical protein
MRTDILPGARFPDYVLPDQTGTPRRLSELQGQDPMVPHTLVLEPGLIVYRVYVGYWFWGRPSNDELWRDLREVSRRCRPDFDPTVPAVREAWAARQGA